MPDYRRRTCQHCRRPDSEVGPISWRGYCSTCGPELMEAALYQLAEHRGPVFDHWRERLAASVGATLTPSPER